MSAAPSMRSMPARSQLRSPGLTVMQAVRSMPRAAHNPRLFIFTSVLIGLVLIALGNLLLSIATSEGVYKVASLKNEQMHLEMNTQILGQEVSSLSSDQNLSSAAQVLGMVTNTNPVFLDVTAQSVQGKPAAALAGGINISGNLVANSVMTSKTSAKDLRAAVASQERKATMTVLGSPVKLPSVVSGTKTSASTRNTGSAPTGYVGGGQIGGSQVSLPNSIPASPTH